MTAASMIFGGAASATSTPVEQVRTALSRFPLWKLAGAEVFKSDVADTSNPGAYYHRWVVLKYRTWLGVVRSKVVYFEQTAFDEYKQEEAFSYVKSLLKAVNA